VPEDTKLFTSLVQFNLPQSESFPGPPCNRLLPELSRGGTWTSPLHPSCCSSATKKTPKLLQSRVILLAGFSQGAGAFTWKGHGPASFPKTSFAGVGQDKFFFLLGVLEEVSLLPFFLFSV